MIIPTAFAGVKIIENDRCLAKEFRFKESKNRSRRLHKKLTRRIGGQIFYKPSAYMLGDKIYAHPEIVAHVKAASEVKSIDVKITI